MPPRTRQNLHRQGIIGELTELGHYMTDSEAGLEKLNKTPVSRLKVELKRLKNIGEETTPVDFPDDAVSKRGGGYVEKKYAHGGSVRKTKLSDY